MSFRTVPRVEDLRDYVGGDPPDNSSALTFVTADGGWEDSPSASLVLGNQNLNSLPSSERGGWTLNASSPAFADMSVGFSESFTFSNTIPGPTPSWLDPTGKIILPGLYHVIVSMNWHGLSSPSFDPGVDGLIEIDGVFSLLAFYPYRDQRAPKALSPDFSEVVPVSEDVVPFSLAIGAGWDVQTAPGIGIRPGLIIYRILSPV